MNLVIQMTDEQKAALGELMFQAAVDCAPYGDDENPDDRRADINSVVNDPEMGSFFMRFAQLVLARPDVVVPLVSS